MHADRKIEYKVGGVERLCLNITDKNMQLQQQGNRGNHVVFPCDHGNLVCMSDKARGIVEIADGVRLQHGCPQGIMEAVGSRASFTVVMDVCFRSKAVKNTVLKQLLSWFTILFTSIYIFYPDKIVVTCYHFERYHPAYCTSIASSSLVVL